ncbi:MAG: hypothetical protein WC906_04735 [Parcubacteria group bacterium]
MLRGILLIKRKAFNVPLCDPNVDESCEALICSEGEKDCSYELCAEGNADGIECNDPEQYNIDNPADEEEETACKEGDEECLQSEESDCEEGDEACLLEEEASDEESLSAEEAPCDSETEDCIDSAVPTDSTDEGAGE